MTSASQMVSANVVKVAKKLKKDDDESDDGQNGYDSSQKADSFDEYGELDGERQRRHSSFNMAAVSKQTSMMNTCQNGSSNAFPAVAA